MDGQRINMFLFLYSQLMSQWRDRNNDKNLPCLHSQLQVNRNTRWLTCLLHAKFSIWLWPHSMQVFLFTHFLVSRFFFFLILFLYFWLHWVFIATCGLSLVAARGGYSLVLGFWWAGFPLRGLLSLQSTGPRACRLQELGCKGLVAQRHVGSSQTRDWIVLCTGRQMLNPWAKRRILSWCFMLLYISSS